MAWKTVQWKERMELITSIQRAAPHLKLNPERCFIDVAELGFYATARLLRLVGDGVPNPPVWFLRMPEETLVLMGSLNNILYCNGTSPLILNDQTIHDYLKFVYFFAEGAYIVETQVKRSSVGYTGKIWVFKNNKFEEIDINVSTKGLVTELEKTATENPPNITDLSPETLGF